MIASASAPAFVQPLGGVDELMQYARDARLKVRSTGQRKLTTVESERLKAPPGQIWLVVEGVRMAGSEPVALSRIYVAPAYVSVAAQVRDWDGAILYFDASGRVAGLHYNAYHNRWEPDWAAPAPGGGP